MPINFVKALNMSLETLQRGIQISQIAPWLGDIALKYGYLGAFFMSFLGSISIVFPVPYTMMIFVMGGLLDPKLLALSAGAGSALGEMLGYIIGYCGGSFISEERRRRMKTIARIFEKYGVVAVFIFALTPLPDDLILIPIGIMHMPFIKAFIPCLFGKIAMCFILAYSGKFLGGLAVEFAGGEANPIIAIAAGIFLVVIIIAILKIDWEKLLLEGHKFIKPSSNK
ncbi:MAG: VTT domain-containing protein [Candidatus Bathyarchaeia archaeon]